MRRPDGNTYIVLLLVGQVSAADGVVTIEPKHGEHKIVMVQRLVKVCNFSIVFYFVVVVELILAKYSGVLII